METLLHYDAPHCEQAPFKTTGLLDILPLSSKAISSIPVVENHVTLPGSANHQFLRARSASAVHDAVEAKLVFCAE